MQKTYSQQEILTLIKSLVGREKVNGVLIFGAPGVGKTEILNRLCGETDKEQYDMELISVLSITTKGDNLFGHIKRFADKESSKRKVLIIDEYERMFKRPSYLPEQTSAHSISENDDIPYLDVYGHWDNKNDQIDELRKHLCEFLKQHSGSNKNFIVIAARLPINSDDYDLIERIAKKIPLDSYILGLLSEAESKQMIDEIQSVKKEERSIIQQNGGLHPGLLKYFASDRDKLDYPALNHSKKEFENFAYEIVSQNTQMRIALNWILAAEEYQPSDGASVERITKFINEYWIEQLNIHAIIRIEKGGIIKYPSAHMRHYIQRRFPDEMARRGKLRLYNNLLKIFILGLPLAVAFTFYLLYTLGFPSAIKDSNYWKGVYILVMFLFLDLIIGVIIRRLLYRNLD